MLSAGLIVMELVMTAIFTRKMIGAPRMEMGMQTQGTRRILHAVLVVVATTLSSSRNLAQMFLTGMIVYQLIITATGTRSQIKSTLIGAARLELTLQTQGTRRILIAVLVVVATTLKS
jgi:hypothetical protein